MPSSNATIGMRRPQAADFCPNVRPLKGPRSKQDDQFVSSFQEIEDVFLEVRPRIDLRLIEERHRAARFDLPSDLFCDPSVLATMAHENEPLFGRLLAHRSALLYLNAPSVACIALFRSRDFLRPVNDVVDEHHQGLSLIKHIQGPIVS
jgi:hypothetical protein